MRIAIIKLGALGDVVRTTGVLRLLKKRYPKSEIWWFTAPNAVPLLEQNPFLHTVIPFEAKTPVSMFSSETFDLVLSLDEEAWACDLSTALRARDRVGTYRDERQQIRYTPSSNIWFDMSLLNRDTDGSLKTANHLKQLNKKTYPHILSEMLGAGRYVPEDLRPVIAPDSEAKQQGFLARFSAQRRPSRPLIGLNSSAGARWVNKQMSLTKSKDVIAGIVKRFDADVILLGGRDEAERHVQLMKNAPTGVIEGGTNHSLRDFISLVNGCDVIITSDSLTLHLACALRKPFVVFFGPTSSTEIELYEEGAAWLPDQPCQCFYRPACENKKGFCLDLLSEEWLEKQLQRMLGAQRVFRA